MTGIDPMDFFGFLHRRYIEVDDNRFLVASHNNAHERLVWVGVYLLVRRKRRDVNKVAGAGLGAKLQPFTPAHPCPAADYVNDTFQFPMMMGSSFSIGVDRNCAGPELICPCHSTVDRSGARHAGCLRRIEIELIAVDNANTVLPPGWFRLDHLLFRTGYRRPEAGAGRHA